MKPTASHKNIPLQLAQANEQQLKNDKIFFKQLSTYLNDLIQSDFEQLIALLYRIDVNEKKLRNILATPGTQLSSDVIAQLIIDRQLEKIITRRNTKQNPRENNEEELW